MIRRERPPRVQDGPWLKCEGKTGYSDLGVAEHSLRNREQQVGHKLYLYECPRCGKFHMSRMPPIIHNRMTDYKMGRQR